MMKSLTEKQRPFMVSVLILMTAGLLLGQTASDVQTIINQSPQEIRNAATEAGYDASDVDMLTERARNAGVSEADIQKVLTGQTELDGAAKIKDPGILDFELSEDGTNEAREDWYKRGDSGQGELKPFGYRIFNYSPKTFEPRDYAAVDPDYPVGPGDEIVVYLWGDVELTHKLTVNRDGKVFIPKVGMVTLNGLTLARVEQKIKDRMAQVYSGLKNHRVRMDVTMGGIKRIRVYMHGEVVKPGGYSLSNMTTVFHALYFSGGPTNKGSLRKIQLIRDSRVVETIDLYDYLISGDKKGDMRLQEDDILLIPPKGRTVTLKGAVFRPARYELQDRENMKKLLDFAGGLIPESYTINIHIERTVANAGVELVDVNLSQLLKLKSHDFILEDGDIVTIEKIESAPANYVTIVGEVLMPGQYELKDNMVVMDLIHTAGGLLKSGHTERIEVARIEAEVKAESPVLFTISKETGELEKFQLKPYDRVYIRRNPKYEMQHNVSVAGEVWFPGTYALDIHKEERISDVISRAGGLKDEAFVMGMVFRRSGEGVIDVAMEATRDRKNVKGENNLILRDGDIIYLPKVPQTVQVSGHVFFPANLVYQKGLSVDEYIKRAGGYKDKADKSKVNLIYPNGRIKEIKKGFLFLSINAEVPPGARIIVPKDESESFDWRGAVKDITTILSSVAMTIFMIQRLD